MVKWNCNDNCAYKRYPKIPPSDTFDADVAVVGEAPGISELGYKEPFVGDTGDVLKKSLASLGFPSIENIFLTNALLCRPPKKPIKVEALETCYPRLVRELNEVKPKVVLVLGAYALKSLMKDSSASITKYHTKAFKNEDIPGAIFVPVYHPAALFRAPGKYKTYIQGLIYASIILRQGEEAIRNPGDTEYELITNSKNAIEILEGMAEREAIVSADIETGGFNQWEDPVLCIGICEEPGKTYVFPIEDVEPGNEEYDNVLEDVPKHYFNDGRIKWCWHDGSFDTPFLRLSEDIPAEMHHDTILMHYCLDEHAGGHDLETLSKRFLGADAYEHKVKQYAKGKDRGFMDVPKEVLYPYQAKDSDYTQRLQKLFLPRIKDDENLNKLYHDLLIPASKFLRGLFEYGFYVNVEHTKRIGEKLKAEEQQKLEEIREYLQPYWNPEKYKRERNRKTAGTNGDESLFNPNSVYQLAWILYDQLGLPQKRGKGRSTDKEVMDFLENKHPAATLIKEFRSIKKRYGTYVKGILSRVHEDGRIHSRFSLYRTTTGRLSSRNPNLQNIQKEKDIRSIFMAPPGRTLLDVDYSGAELRVLQYLSGDEELLKIFNEGRDLHDEVAISQFGQDFTRKDRMKAKTLNFGIPYGRSAYSIAEAFEMSLEDAQEMIDGWYERFPKAGEYLKQCDRDAEQGKALVSPFGRIRRLGLISDLTIENLKREARNFRVQSVASDLTLTSGIKLQPMLEKYDAHIVNIVHDSLTIEIDDDPALIDEVAHLVAREMMKTPKEELGAEVVFTIDAEVGSPWGELEDYELTKLGDDINC